VRSAESRAVSRARVRGAEPERWWPSIFDCLTETPAAAESTTPLRLGL